MVVRSAAVCTHLILDPSKYNELGMDSRRLANVYEDASCPTREKKTHTRQSRDWIQRIGNNSRIGHALENRAQRDQRADWSMDRRCVSS